MTPWLLRLLALSLLVFAGACFHYVPTEQAPVRGTPVWVSLSRPIPVQLSELTANGVVRLRGELVSAGPEDLVVSVFSLRSQSGFEYRSLGETVALPADAVEGIEQRRFSLVRTVVSGAVLGAAGYLIQRTLRGAIGGGEPGDGPGDVR